MLAFRTTRHRGVSCAANIGTTEVARFGLPRSRHRRRIVRALGCDCRGGITGLAPIPGDMPRHRFSQRVGAFSPHHFQRTRHVQRVSLSSPRARLCVPGGVGCPVPVVTAVAKAAPCVGRPARLSRRAHGQALGSATTTAPRAPERIGPGASSLRADLLRVRLMKQPGPRP